MLHNDNFQRLTPETRQVMAAWVRLMRVVPDVQTLEKCLMALTPAYHDLMALPKTGKGSLRRRWDTDNMKRQMGVILVCQCRLRRMERKRAKKQTI